MVHLRAKHKDHSPNKWDTRFGGHLKSGESYDDAALSEIKEEVGLDLKLSDFILGPIVKKSEHNNNEFGKIYFFNFLGDEKNLNFSDNEVSEIKWLFAKEIIEKLKSEPEIWAPDLADFKLVFDYLNKF